MTEQDAVENLHGLLCSYDNGPFNELDLLVAKDVLRSWLLWEGSKTFEALVDLMARGHTVTSPLNLAFRYTAGSLAGQQKSLPGIT